VRRLALVRVAHVRMRSYRQCSQQPERRYEWQPRHVEREDRDTEPATPKLSAAMTVALVGVAGPSERHFSPGPATTHQVVRYCGPTMPWF
jgi:hypothetical protein